MTLCELVVDITANAKREDKITYPVGMYVALGELKCPMA